MRKLVAVLRGISPPEALPVARALVDAGFSRIEVTLDSPQPLVSIADMIEVLGDVADFGAGTVLSAEEVTAVVEIGGKFIVSPNCDTAVIRATKDAGLLSFPGVLTPTECFTALAAGADALKIFPAAQLGVAGMRALKAVIPKTTELYAVGGVDAAQFDEWMAAGADGFGVGAALFRSGMDVSEVARRAHGMVEHYDAAVKKHAV